ncbi:MAG: hypothetical protein A3H35_15665 [Betaproteobacteria bacterium RIFCSPLOWO2_02_FULL_62_17]|nr:MAG: hypothetical protein A3H35_15665 [Betaproteobacteria bacterium RIFCSPLOWO2_02_FULL_62_17]
MDGTLVMEGGQMVFRRGQLALVLPTHVAERVAGQAGRAVVLGIRAEDVASHSGESTGDCLQGRILSVLPVGSDQFLEVEVEGTKLFFRVGKEGQHKDGENAVLRVNLNRLHLFDKQDSQSLVW